ncbi:MAG TPA: phosphoribosyl-ATP diphosphatase [Anaerolineae bacterium]|nr:phosphoribosyl-ATP diphosphatase [Anaerolineae bacterium]
MTDFLTYLNKLVHERKNNPQPNSYTTELFAAGPNKISQKVGEEAVEVIVAALGQTPDRLISESADLLYHLLVLLAHNNLSLDDITAELARRHPAPAQPATPTTTTRYAHTNIIAQDWQTLAHFYQTVFDCTPVPPQRDQQGSWLEQGTGVPHAHIQGIHLRLPGLGPDGPTLEIYSYDTMLAQPQPAANRLGLGHLAFLVDDVPAKLDQLIKAGGQSLGQPTHHHVPDVGHLHFVYAADPEGNIIEIQNWS